MDALFEKLLASAPAVAALVILVITFVRYLKSRDDRSERQHERFSLDLKGVAESHERTVERVASSFDRSNAALLKKLNGNNQQA